MNQANFAQLATVNSDGSPHIDTVWFHYKEEGIIIATTMATKKAQNISSNPSGYIVVTNQDNPYEQVQIKVMLEKIETDAELAICDSITPLDSPKPPQGSGESRGVIPSYAQQASTGTY